MNCDVPFAHIIQVRMYTITLLGKYPIDFRRMCVTVSTVIS